jgi:hypothetical protein
VPPPRVEAVGRVVGEVVTARACLVAGTPVFLAHVVGVVSLSPPSWWFSLWAVLLGLTGSPTQRIATDEVRTLAAEKLAGGRILDVLARAAVLVALVVIYDSGGVGPPPRHHGVWIAVKALFGLATMVATMSTPYTDPGLSADLRQHTARRRVRAAAGFALLVAAVAFSYRRPLFRLFFGVELGPTLTSPDPSDGATDQGSR